MNKLTTLLEGIHPDASGDNIASILKAAYPSLVADCSSGSKCLATVFKAVVSRAPVKFSKTWKKLFIAMNTVINILYLNENTRASYLTILRAPLRSDRFHPDIYTQSTHLMGLGQARSRERKEEYADEVKARNMARGELVPIFVGQIYSLLDYLIAQNDPYELALAVALATGSRAIEVFQVSTYSIIDGPVYQVKVKGLAKDNSRSTNNDDMVVIRNIVKLTNTQIVDAVAKIRELLPTLATKTRREVTYATNAKCNRVFKQYVVPLFAANAGDRVESEGFKRQLKGLTFHKCRYIGGNASYQIYGAPKQIPESTYLQDQYGHQSADSTQSYLAVIVTDSPGATGSGVVAGIDALSQFKNSHSRSESEHSKVMNVVLAIKTMRESGVSLLQKQLQKRLGYSSAIMSKGYRLARNEGLFD